MGGHKQEPASQLSVRYGEVESLPSSSCWEMQGLSPKTGVCSRLVRTPRCGHLPSAQPFMGLKKGLNDLREDILHLYPIPPKRLFLVEGVVFALNIFSK